MTSGLLLTRLASLALGMAFLGGCGETPRAPPLRDDPVYLNDREGFRFLVPEGWQQRIRGEVPGKADRERPLVEYRPIKAGEGPGSLRVSRIDLPPSADLGGQVAAPSHSVEKWVPVTAAEETAVGGAEGGALLADGEARQGEAGEGGGGGAARRARVPVHRDLRAEGQ